MINSSDKAYRKYDLVVCGGGMTGVACAVSAARQGLKTVIIEKQGCLGGVGTSGQVNHILGGGYHDDKTQYHQVIGGIFEELSKKMISLDSAIDPSLINPSKHRHGWLGGLASGLIFDNEMMKIVLDDMCVKAGVHIWFFTNIIGVGHDENEITKIAVHNKSGVFEIEGKYFADTTGDADIAFMSGCPVIHGREEDGLMAPASLEMVIEKVDGNKLEEYIIKQNSPRFRSLINDLRAKGVWDFPYDIFICVQLVYEDVYMINTIRQVGVDGTNGDSVSKAMIAGRKESLKLFRIIKEYFPGFENSRIRSIAPNIGIRETRRIAGEYCLSVSDLIEGKEFDDTIAYSCYGWDLPDPKRPSAQPMHGVKKNKLTPIPFICMLPKKIRNLIVAGRSISVEREVLGPIRVMAPCIAMGQASGTAAAIAFYEGIGFSDINNNILIAKLRQDGCIV